MSCNINNYFDSIVLFFADTKLVASYAQHIARHNCNNFAIFNLLFRNHTKQLLELFFVFLFSSVIFFTFSDCSLFNPDILFSSAICCCKPTTHLLELLFLFSLFLFQTIYILAQQTVYLFFLVVLITQLINFIRFFVICFYSLLCRYQPVLKQITFVSNLFFFR